jgi:hypothetical protein
VNFVLEDVVATKPVCLVVGCTLQITSQLQLFTPVGSPDTTAGIRSASVDLRRSMAVGERSGRSNESIHLLFLRRNGIPAARIFRSGAANGAPHPWMPVAIRESR